MDVVVPEDQEVCQFRPMNIPIDHVAVVVVVVVEIEVMVLQVVDTDLAAKMEVEVTIMRVPVVVEMHVNRVQVADHQLMGMVKAVAPRIIIHRKVCSTSQCEHETI